MTAPAEPRPVADIDTQLRDAISSVYRFRWLAMLVTGMVLAGSVVYLGTLAWSQQQQIGAQQVLARDQQAQIRAQQAQLASSCSFFGPLTGLPVTTPGPGKPASKVGVQIIAGARTAYSGQRCGKITRPAGSLLTWAAYWHIPVAR